jgi:hypothetical protein
LPRVRRTAGQDRVSMVEWRRSSWCQLARRRSAAEPSCFPTSRGLALNTQRH